VAEGNKKSHRTAVFFPYEPAFTTRRPLDRAIFNPVDTGQTSEEQQRRENGCDRRNDAEYSTYKSSWRE
jgi:hypothetical protein